MEEVGKGSVSKMYSENGVAIKVYNNISSQENDYETEVECLKMMKGCKYVIQYISHDTQMGSITMELCPGNTTSLMIKKNHHRQTWIENFMTDVLQADYMMDKMGIFHGDINFNNTLYYIGEYNNIHFKVCDFSHSTILEEGGQLTKPYPLAAAPEWFKVNYKILDTSQTSTWTIANLVFFIRESRFLVNELLKNSCYYKPGVEFYSDDHMECLESLLVDSLEGGEFRQEDINDMVDAMDLSFFKDPLKTKKFLYSALTIDNRNRITSGEALGILIEDWDY
jgi:serine/threonine protein kinase